MTETGGPGPSSGPAVGAAEVIMSDETARRPIPGALAVDTGDAGGAGHAGPVLPEAWLHRLAAAIQARAEVSLGDRRLRTWMEIPRGPEAAG
jgi:hypothetical protein